MHRGCDSVTCLSRSTLLAHINGMTIVDDMQLRERHALEAQATHHPTVSAYRSEVTLEAAQTYRWLHAYIISR